ncbi:hypothetical protein C0991_009607 [Blastosporella zonata]|nr:hypothetical protein C0991_009607 [Blastosporella zonata]
MVRTNTNQNEPSDDKKETTAKKRSAPRKKTVVTGVWPCKINGCNKQFAREADLKRHQRTTKLHSMPTPVRSAMRILQGQMRSEDTRSHGELNQYSGVEVDNDADDDRSSGSQSKSRSATPSSKGKETAHPHPQPAPYPTPTATRSGPSSYYRQHTLTTGPYVPRQYIMDPNYAQADLPTTRLNLATHWGYPHPWPDGPGAPQQMSYQQMYYAPHYRPPNGTNQLSGSIPPPSAQHPTPGAPQHPSAPPCPPDGPQDTIKQANTEGDASAVAADASSLPMDPSLDPHESTELTAEQIMQITKALLQEQSVHDRSSAESRDGSASTTAFSETDRGTASGSQDEHDADEGKDHAMRGYGHPLVRPEPMEHMLTEDGEPMLNPGALAGLT